MKSEQTSTFGASVTDSVDHMMRLPIKMTEGALDAVMDGVRWMAGGMSHASPEHMDAATYADTTRATITTKDTPEPAVEKAAKAGIGDQDLHGKDLKYVVWSIVFTKPGFETVLEPQHEELVNYEADANMYAAMKIAKFVETAQSGKATKPEVWSGRSYPADLVPEEAEKPESTSFFGSNKQDDDQDKPKGWRIPAEDQRYITFLYRIDRRLPRQEREVTRVETVTVERTSTDAPPIR